MFLKNTMDKLQGIQIAVSRYPLAVFFIVSATIVNMLLIQTDVEQYLSFLLTLLVGAVFGIVAQQVYEQFFREVKVQLMLYVGAVICTIGYYMVIPSADLFTIQMGIQTTVMLCALLMVFIWIPSIGGKYSFHGIFMATFKAFFTTVLFGAILSIGLNLVIFAFDQLLFGIDYTIYLHMLNFIVTLFSPLFFLSLIPLYTGVKSEREKVEEAMACPKLLGVLLSYVVLPLTGVYTFILLAYVLLNIRGDFWTNNLLEPMLIAYTITVILVLILISNLSDGFTVLCRKILPKVLLPIVLFQLVASTLKIGEVGITHGRYYVLLFGVYALIAGVIFGFLPIRKSGWVAAFLIVFSVVSIIPPIDAFTVSRVSQTKLLEQTLAANGMWVGGEITPNSDISIAEKRKITGIVNYLERMEYTEDIAWLQEDVNSFGETFGFGKVYGNYETADQGQSVYLEWGESLVIHTEGYDRLLRLNISSDVGGEPVSLTIEETAYQLVEEVEDADWYLILTTEGETLIRFNLKEMATQMMKESGELTTEKASVTEENGLIRMTVITSYLDRYDASYNGEVYVLVDVK